MRLSFSRTKIFVPEFNGNADLPEDKQLKFKIKPMDLGDFTDAFERVAGLIGPDGKVDTAKVSGEKQKEFLLLGAAFLPKYVESVGAPLLASDSEEPLTVPEIVTLPPLMALTVELVWATILQSSPTDGDIKN
jgi:hypothetical protein